MLCGGWGAGHCKDRAGIRPAWGQSCEPKVTHTAWRQVGRQAWGCRLSHPHMCQEPWALWETPRGHRAELGVQVWSHSAADVLRALRIGTAVAGLHAFRLVIRAKGESSVPKPIVLLKGLCLFFSLLRRQGIEGNEDAVDKSATADVVECVLPVWLRTRRSAYLILPTTARTRWDRRCRCHFSRAHCVW